MKKVLSLLLCICMLLTLPTAANAEEGTNTAGAQAQQSESVTPVIVVPGIGSSALYLNPNSDYEASPISVDKSFVKLLRKTHLVKYTLSACFGKSIDW